MTRYLSLGELWYLAEYVTEIDAAIDDVSRAMTKLHARDRAQLVVLAFRSGLTRLGDLD